MSKKENLKVLSFDERLIGKMNKEIRDMIILNTKDNNTFYTDLDQQMQICEAGNPDINYLAQFDDSIYLQTYVEDRRNLLINSYRARVHEEITRLTSCICMSMDKVISTIPFNSQDIYCYVDEDRINRILIRCISEFPQSYFSTSNEIQNAQDLNVINNLIPTSCVELNAYLKDFMNNIITRISSKIQQDNTDESITKTIGSTIIYLTEMIESITFTTQTTLVAVYCDIKDYVQNTIEPLGYPNISIVHNDAQ